MSKHVLKFLTKSVWSGHGSFYKIFMVFGTLVCSVLLAAYISNLFVRAGTLNPAAPPGDTMSTLDYIYCAMTADCTPTEYGINSPGAPAATMRTLTEIYNKAVNFPLTDASRNASFTSGAATCYNATVIWACPVPNFPSQDAEYTSANAFTSDMSYTSEGNATTTDNTTGLMWQKCTFGRSGSDCLTGTATTTRWQGALADCDALLLCNDGTFSGSAGIAGDCSGHNGTAYDDWRLPNVKELISIVDFATSSPAVAHSAPSTIYFPATVSLNYWSATTDVDDPSDAWYVYFYVGDVNAVNKTDSNYVRCVRGS